MSEAPEQGADTGHELADQIPQGLPDPGAPIMLVVKVDADGNGSTRYLCTPEHALDVLRSIVGQIEAEIAQRRDAEELL